MLNKLTLVVSLALTSLASASFCGLRFNNTGRTYQDIKDLIDFQFLGRPGSPNLEIPMAVDLVSEHNQERYLRCLFPIEQEIKMDDIEPAHLPWDQVTDMNEKRRAAFYLTAFDFVKLSQDQDYLFYLQFDPSLADLTEEKRMQLFIEELIKNPPKGVTAEALGGFISNRPTALQNPQFSSFLSSKYSPDANVFRAFIAYEQRLLEVIYEALFDLDSRAGAQVHYSFLNLQQSFKKLNEYTNTTKAHDDLFGLFQHDNTNLLLNDQNGKHVKQLQGKLIQQGFFSAKLPNTKNDAEINQSIVSTHASEEPHINQSTAAPQIVQQEALVFDSFSTGNHSRSDFKTKTIFGIIGAALAAAAAAVFAIFK